ncbi:uncharacterized protein VTP21DRAFT_6584 [Calcarisporiella thermophila]|uniref:uncharacterized protein n=1 Tax=Calcarisporiella thermophila TaxID=911321 RepID=UPI0037441AE0
MATTNEKQKVTKPNSYVTTTSEEARMEQSEQLRYFLATAPTSLTGESSIKRHPAGDAGHIACVLWHNLFHITSRDIYRALHFRFETLGRMVVNEEQLESEVFAALGHLRIGPDAILEESGSEFLQFLHENGCVLSTRKQKVYFWFSVPHDQIFVDILGRELQREQRGEQTLTVAMAEPALSISAEGPDGASLRDLRSSLLGDEAMMSATQTNDVAPLDNYNDTRGDEGDGAQEEGDQALKMLESPLEELAEVTPPAVASDLGSRVWARWDKMASIEHPKLPFFHHPHSHQPHSQPHQRAWSLDPTQSWDDDGCSMVDAMQMHESTPPPSQPQQHAQSTPPSTLSTPHLFLARNGGRRRAHTVSEPPSTAEENSAASSKLATRTPTKTRPYSRPTSSEPDESRPFVCPFPGCQRPFKRLQHWKRHIRSSHSNIRPYECTLCGKSFTRSDSLTVHKRTHLRQMERQQQQLQQQQWRLQQQAQHSVVGFHPLQTLRRRSMSLGANFEQYRPNVPVGAVAPMAPPMPPMENHGGEFAQDLMGARSMLAMPPPANYFTMPQYPMPYSLPGSIAGTPSNEEGQWLENTAAITSYSNM